MTRNKKIINTILYPIILVVVGLFLVFLSSCAPASNDFEVSYTLENTDDGMTLKWESDPSATINISAKENGKDKKLSSKARSYNLNTDSGTVYEFVLSVDGNASSVKKIHVEFLSPLTKDDITLYQKDGTVDISLDTTKYSDSSKGCTATYYYKINNNEKSSKENTMTIPVADINKLSAAVHYKKENSEAGEYTYAIANYSSTFDIKTQAADIHMKPLDAMSYKLDCSGNESSYFSTFDVSLSSSKGEVFEKDGVQANMLSSAVKIPALELPTEDLVLSVRCHGIKTSKLIVCDTDYQKTIKYRKTEECQIATGTIKLPVTDNTISYYVSRKAYGYDVEAFDQTSTTVALSAGIPYQYSILPDFSDDCFTHPVTTDWFLFASSPILKLSENLELTYIIDKAMNSQDNLHLQGQYFNTIVDLMQNDIILDSVQISDQGLVSYSNKADVLMKDPGLYTVRCYTIPKEGCDSFKLPNGEMCYLEYSGAATAKIYRSEKPEVSYTKTNSGRDILFTATNSTDVYLHLSGSTDQKFNSLGNNTYSLIYAHDRINKFEGTKGIQIYGRNNQQDSDTYVLPSTAVTIEKISLDTPAPSTMTLKLHEDQKYYAEFAQEEKGNYLLSLYRITGGTESEFVGSASMNGYATCIDDLFGTAERLAGQYKIVYERTSSMDNVVNSDTQTHSFTKLAAPVKDVENTNEYYLAWTNDPKLNPITGYQVFQNGAQIHTQTSGFLPMYKDELALGETVYQIYCYGGENELPSEPLTLKVYRFDTPAITLKNGIASLSNSLEGFNYVLVYEIYEPEEDKKMTDGSGSVLNLTELTSSEDWATRKDVKYELRCTLTAQHPDYAYIYSSSTVVEFVKKGTPILDLSNQMVSEVDGRHFLLKIDEEGFIHSEKDINTLPLAGKVMLYYIPAENDWEVDSCIATEKFSD